MIRILLLASALLLLATAARSDGLGNYGILGQGEFGGIGGGLKAPTPPPPLTNLRITNTGAFRITNTGANRAVFP